MNLEETRAAKYLDDYLRANGNSSSFVDGPDPPDAIFTVNGEDWDVEITELHPYIEVGGVDRSRTGVEIGLAKIFEEIKTETNGIRRREYEIVLGGPFSSSEKIDIKRSLVGLIKENFSEEKDLLGDGRCILKSKGDKVTDLHGFIMLSGIARGPKGKMIADIGASIDFSVSRALTDKNRMFIGLGGSNKKVLLIYSKHFFAEPENVSKAAANNFPVDSPIDEIYLAWDSKVARVFPG